MLKLAANLTLMFNEMPFLDRFEAAADAGFRGVECIFPYEHPAEVVPERLSRVRRARLAEGCSGTSRVCQTWSYESSAGPAASRRLAV